MIAANYRKHADALIRQTELDLSGVLGASESQRGAWWDWLLKAGIPQPARVAAIPRWLAAARKARMALAKAVKRACAHLFENLTAFSVQH